MSVCLAKTIAPCWCAATNGWVMSGIDPRLVGHALAGQVMRWSHPSGALLHIHTPWIET